MKQALILLSALAAAVTAQGVTEQIAPVGSHPDSCSEEANGPMWVTVKDVKELAKRDLHKRVGQCIDGHLVVTLNKGVLTDAQHRIGYIASNFQFQFDAPAQDGALYTAGFSRCGNGSLALGPTTTFYKCRSGDFWNLYDRSWAAQCDPVKLVAFACTSGVGAAAGGVGQIPDGQVVATRFIATTVVQPIADGQPQVVTTAVPVPICQIGDGQVQGHTTPCADVPYAPEASDHATGDVPVSQYSDGQIQVTEAGGSVPRPEPTVPATGGAGVPPASLSVPTEGGGDKQTPTSSASTPPTPSGSASAPPPSDSTPAQGGSGRMEASVGIAILGFVSAFALL